MQFNKETPTGSFVIQGQSFSIPRPFAEGHTCTKSEADVLNQTLAENARNNMSANVKKAIDAGDFDLVKVQADIDGYLEDYDFGVRRGRAPADPVEREALVIAREAVKTALRQKGFKLADVAAEDIARLAEDAIAANAEITKEAKRRVDQRAKLGVDQLDLSSVAV